MNKPLTMDDIDSNVKKKTYQQKYSPSTTIQDVKLYPLKNNIGEDTDFSELFRLNSNGEIGQIPGFKLAQVSIANIPQHTIQGWHLHLKLDEIWYIHPTHRLFVGLWDIREKSTTKGSSMRLMLGVGQSQLLFIPHGVAHGCANHFGALQLIVLVNQQFNLKDPDERRIPWDTLGADFWSPQRD